MSVQNGERLATKQDLADMYQEILPYLGGSADAGFTPVGSIIAIMGVTAPANYLACNGQIVNIADYPELANYFYQQFGSKNKFGGNGTTTFAVPDLRGEFLRGTGTNGHSGQGSGSTVGTHQDSTTVRSELAVNVNDNVGLYIGHLNKNNVEKIFSNLDSSYGSASATTYTTDVFQRLSQTARTDGRVTHDTLRPTNTSVLWCIATKDIYLNPAMDYSTSEKVVGKWIDGKTIYQRTIQTTSPVPSSDGQLNEKFVDLGVSIDSVINISSIRNSNHAWGMFPLTNPLNQSSVNYIMMAFVYDNSASNNTNKLRVTNNCSSWANVPIYVTIQYTKTTT